jgi:hypothetical protein
MSKILTLLFTLIFSQVFSQTVFELDQEKTIEVYGSGIPIPFSQGINSAQIQTIDLNGDGIEEWVVWDINSRQLQVFAKEGESFQILPELAYYFPAEISGFLVLADFDLDGKKDLFTSTPLGIKAYRNTSQGSQISWAVAQNFLKLDEANNIPANNLDTPLLQDLDGDGDLDLVIFNVAQGDFLEFFKNTSIERKGTPDIDGFAFPVDFWGNMVFCGCEDISFGVRCDGRPIDFRLDFDENDRILHAGGHSILYQDFSGDGLLDLVIGRDECSSLYYLVNQGSNTEPLFDHFSQALPDYGYLPEFPIYHVGKLISEDLIISLNTSEASSTYGIDFAESIVKLSSDGSGPRPILQDQLLDLGENTRPYFQGRSSFGTLALSSNRKINGKTQSQLDYFHFQNDRFELNSEDIYGFSTLELLDLQFLDYTDVSRENHFQLAIGTKLLNGIPSQKMYRVIDGITSEFSISGLNLRVGDHLEFFPYQGKDYLLLASQNGSLTLYEADLVNLSATQSSTNFLGFQDNPANRNLTFAIQSKANPDLYTVDQTGRIFWIKDFMNSDVREEVLVKIGAQNFPLRLGRNTWITLVKPDFSEVADLILGTRGGGIIYLKAAISEFPNENEFLVKLFPNPSSGPTTVVTNQASTGRLVNSLGQILMDQLEIPANREVILQTQILTPGLYFLQLESENKQVLVKKILIR